MSRAPDHRGEHHAAEELRLGAALSAKDGGNVPVIGPAASASVTYGGGGSAAVLPSATVSPLQGVQAAAGPGTTVGYTQGLPTDTSLPAIPAADLSPAYAPTPFGGSYTGTLTATFTVTPPSYAPNTSQTVHATADLGGSDTREAGVTVTVGG